jgi:hypothetical protein
MTPSTIIKFIEKVFKHRLFHWQPPLNRHCIASPAIAVVGVAVAILAVLAVVAASSVLVEKYTRFACKVVH